MITQRKPIIAYGWLRALLGFIFFLLLYIVVSGIAGRPSQNNLLLSVIIVNACFLVSAYVFRRFVDRKTFASLGFSWQSKSAVTGSLTAIVVIGGGSLLLWIIGDLKITGTQFVVGQLLNNILIFAIVALGEELFFRGYILNNLMDSFNKWVALFISALFFLFVHLDNPGATASIIPVISIITGGILFGINYVYTKNLWFSIFLHFAWNFLQGPVLGYDVSGTVSRPIFTHTLTGPPLITGGTFGYEGSIICILFSILSIGILSCYLNLNQANDRAPVLPVT